MPPKKTQRRRRRPEMDSRRRKPKPCQLCKLDYVDYKDVALLRKYMSDRGKIRGRRVSGACPQHQREIAALLQGLAGERTVLTATHELNFASLVADRVLGLRQGTVRALGPPAEVLRREVLMDLFEAPFETVRGGERPVTVLGLEP